MQNKTNLDTETLKSKINKPIVLVGMMGTGKSHAGKLLSQALNLPFIDSDQVIEERAGITINEIFELYGEEKFRDTERKTILELLGQGESVIATGGGALTTPEVLNGIKEQAISIWLQTDIPTLLERLAHAKNRPLLNQDDPEKILANLLNKREYLYEQANCHVQTHPSDIHQTVTNILSSLNSYLIDEA